MEAIRIKGGHKFRLKHRPQAEVVEHTDVNEVGVSPRGYGTLKAKLVVKEGASVKRGEVLFFDKKNVDVKFTSPVAGTVKEIVYGPRRVLIAVKITVADADDAVDFGEVERNAIAQLGSEKVVERIVEGGLWARFVAHPSPGVAPVPGRKPEPDAHGNVPELKVLKSIYVSALATEPHQADPLIALEDNEETFAAGLEAVRQIARTWLFFEKGKKVPAQASSITGVQSRAVVGKYPACDAGVQVYYTESLGKGEVAAALTTEDVIDIGHLFLTGTVRNERIVAVGGNAAKNKKHFKVKHGTSIADLTGLKADDGDLRFIAGGLFTGEKASPDGFLGYKDRAVTVMTEDHARTPFHFQRPRPGNYSLLRQWISGFLPDREGDPTTSNNGEERACVQCGACIDICPVELMPNLIMKAAVTDDIERMEALSIKDCTDCGLCTFICVSKIELDEHIGNGKALIEKEG